MRNERRNIVIEGTKLALSLDEPVVRYPGNPILTSHNVNKVWKAPGRKVITVHNAGITEYEGRVVMLFRSHLRNGISIIGKANSTSGLDRWIIEEKPALMPCNEEDLFGTGTDKEMLIENEAGGVEDPRISLIDDTYYITYSAYHGLKKDRVRVSLATTKNFRDYVRYGPVLEKDMRNVVIFPEMVQKKYFALMRPNDDPSGDHTGGIFKEVRLAETDHIVSGKWTVHKNPVMKQSGGPSSFGDKIGPGATPLKTKHGWLNIFHGVRKTMDGNPYVLGIAFHDLDDPARVRVCSIPVLFPSASDCIVGPGDYVHVPNVVFTCGALRKDDGTILIYYGGNDTVMNLAFSHEDILAALCERFLQDPGTGRPWYLL